MSVTSKKMVVALGGNAISAPGEQGTIEQQFAQSQKTARVLCDAIGDGYQLVITHGNGPQVGNVLRRVEIASRELYPIPLDVCVADTQAGMGYMIAQSIMNELKDRQQLIDVTTLVTTVEVDREDQAFEVPTKPIGPRLSEADALSHQQQDDWKIVRTNENVYRRVVPCPKPRQILELPTIRRLVDAGELVICCGGGGIPVYRDDRGRFTGAAAVIDKDFTSALLARELGILRLVLLTGIDHVYLNFNSPAQQPLEEITTMQARQYLDEGQFASGSMAPKIEAAIDFLNHCGDAGAVVVITNLFKLPAALAGESGTRIVRQQVS